MFASGGSFRSAQQTLSDKAQKAVFKLKRFLYQYSDGTGVKHTLDLFDNLVSPFLTFESQVCAWCKVDSIERAHLSFCKSFLGVKTITQTDFVYGELERTDPNPFVYIMLSNFGSK